MTTFVIHEQMPQDTYTFRTAEEMIVFMKKFRKQATVEETYNGYTDDQWEFYENNPDYVQVNEPASVVLDYLASLSDKNVKATRKVRATSR